MVTLGEMLMHGGHAGEGLDEPYEGAPLVDLGEGVEVYGLGADAGFGGDFDAVGQLLVVASVTETRVEWASGANAAGSEE